MSTMAKPRKRPTSPWRAKLKALREKYGLTQTEAAARVGVAARTWIAWENSQTTPGRFTLPMLRAAFPGEKI
jgi:DNA-binding XRE family transcriptional regulator